VRLIGRPARFPAWVRRPAAGLRAGPTFSAFGLPGFAGIWASASAGAFARIVTQVSLSWLALEATGSPFMVGFVLAARMAPQLVLGLPAGALADWFERRRLIVAIGGLTVLAGLLAAGGALAGLLAFPALVAAALIFGGLDMLRTTATQAYVYDVVQSDRAANGLALTNMGGHLFGALAGLVAGFALERSGGAAAFGLVALAAAVGATSLLLSRSPAVEPVVRPDRARPNLARAAVLLARHRLIAALALAIVLAELFGFSSITLMPTFARDVFAVGAAGLGALMTARSVGGVLGLLLLARLGTGQRSGLVLLGVCGGMGLALALFALSPLYGLALVLMLVVGAFASGLDSLGQILLQRTAPDRERGAAMGIWVFSIGFAPFGHLTLGVAAGALSAPQAQAAAGGLLVLIALMLSLHAPLRQLR
jgi:MFS family permease